MIPSKEKKTTKALPFKKCLLRWLPTRRKSSIAYKKRSVRKPGNRNFLINKGKRRGSQISSRKDKMMKTWKSSWQK